MRPDLLYSQAAVDWTTSNIPAFQKRLDAWITTKLRVGLEELKAHIPNNLLIAGSEEPLPLSFSAEAGAYINTLRSALDMLATTLVQRHNLSIKPHDIYFPIAKDEATFNSGKGFSGWELLKLLPDGDKKIIEALKPYNGGNELLWALHKLDNMRKHQRLLSVMPVPTKLTIGAHDVRKHFTPITTGFIHDGYKIIFGLWSKLAPRHPDVKLDAHITIDEVGLVNKKSVVGVLTQFADHVSNIIKMFDY